MDKVPMTAEGHSAMMDEIKHLKTVERPRIIKLIEEARSHGDLSENAEYHAAKEQQGWIEARVAELEDKISRADVIDISKLSGDTVKFGAKVTLVDEETDDEASYQIVGEFEADVKKGKIYVGGPKQYENYRGLQRKQRISEDKMEAQEMDSVSRTNWGAPGGWQGWGITGGGWN